METKTRAFGPDLVRVVATIFIIGVHFFLYNGYYGQPQIGFAMHMANILRWITFTCVPMFLVLTGYLQGEKKWSASFYTGVIPVFITWIMMTAIEVTFAIKVQHVTRSFWEWVYEIFEYRGANYSWYIELYFVLFLLIPFLNQGFHGKDHPTYHKAIMVTMFFLTILAPSMKFIQIGDKRLSLLPDYFSSLWPIFYYLVGVYIRKYKPVIQGKWGVLAIFFMAFMQNILTYCHSKQGGFNNLLDAGYCDIFTAGITIVVFLLLYRIDTTSKVFREVIHHVAKRCLHIYLISAVFDVWLSIHGYTFSDPKNYWWGFIVKVVVVFTCSLLASEITYAIEQPISKGCIRLFRKK